MNYRNEHNDIRLTDDMERRMVRASANAEMRNTALSGDILGGAGGVVRMLRNMLREINFNMNDIGEARYS